MTIKRISLVIVGMITLFVLFIPIPSTLSLKNGEYNIVRYRLKVYHVYPIDSEGEGGSGTKTLVGEINFRERIGGFLEYFGLKKIDKKKLDSLINRIE